MINNTPQQLHDTYCLKSNQKLPFCQFKFRWLMWAEIEGHTLENLVLVVDHIQRRRSAASEEKYKPSLNLYKLLDDHGWFACQVEAAQSEARAAAAKRRAPQDTNRQEMLKATGRPMEPPDKAVTPESILGRRSVEELVNSMRQAL